MHRRKKRRESRVAQTMKTRLPLVIILLATVFCAKAQPPAAAKNAPNRATATFAGGCFWCMEPPFERLPGVISVVSGYTGGSKTEPSYEEVSSGETGHAESVEVTYDPTKVTYAKL